MAKVAPLDHTSLTVHDSQTADHGVLDAVPEKKSGPRQTEAADSATGARCCRRNRIREAVIRSGWFDLPFVAGVRRLLRGKVFTGVSVFALIFALFLNDIFVTAQVPDNTVLDAILTLVFALFLFELLALIVVDAMYLFSFFFWMDLIGTVWMVMDISYMAGVDATEPETIATRVEHNAIMIVGPLSRLIKALRLLPFAKPGANDGGDGKMTLTLWQKLHNVLSKRVAFLTICIAMFVPLLAIFMYPADDDSMEVWVKLLSMNAEYYSTASNAADSVAMADAEAWLVAETTRFSDFFSDLTYGPFAACYGETTNGEFSCSNDVDVGFASSFKEPRRKNSILEITMDNYQARFNLAVPKQRQAASNLGLVCFVILAMCVFGFMVSRKISEVALVPLERMLSAVRDRCQDIFKYTKDLNEEEEEVNIEESDYFEQSNEFAILEKVVDKLATIVKLATQEGPEKKEEMTENDIMVLNWIQSDQASKKQQQGATAEVDNRSEVASEDGEADPQGITAQQEISAAIKAALRTDDFNALEMTKEERINISLFLIAMNPHTQNWVRNNVPLQRLYRFIVLLEAKYQPNPFHNFSHGVDVAYSLSRFMELCECGSFVNDSMQFWLMVAAIGHDAAHPGVNNQFLIETSHELAVKYNDRAPLENLHCATLFQVVGEPDANIFAHLDKDTYKDMRKGIIHVILHTDMAKHFSMVNDLNLFYQMNSDAFDELAAARACSDSQANLQLVASMFLHGADIGNPMKPWKLAQELAHLCLDEFFDQGDQEKAAGIPVQMMNDRDKVNRPSSQIGFIEFVIAPMAEAMMTLFPPLEGLAENLRTNVGNWNRMWKEEFSPPPEEAAKTDARVQKVELKLSTALDRCKELMS